MPILIDFSQVVIGNIVVQLGKDAQRTNPNAAGLIKHMILNSLLAYKKKFGPKYGDLILCMDGRHYWRKDVFPYYKGNRKKQREESKTDWEFVYEIINEMKAALADNFPYKIVEVDKAEGDDVIAVLAEYFSENELVQKGLFEAPQDVVITSSDTDMCQLQKYGNVSQWSPILKKMISKDSDTYLIEHICTGDSGDGVPNIMSADNCIVDGIRQTPFKKARLEEFYEKGIDACKTETERRNYQRNEQLVDFKFIPADIKQQILDKYKMSPKGSKAKIMNFLVKNKMKLLIDSIGEF